MVNMAKGYAFSTTAPEIGGEVATSFLPDSYCGPCSIVQAFSQRVLATFPNPTEAMTAARMAIQPDGGYGSVDVVCALKEDIDHQTWQAWYF